MERYIFDFSLPHNLFFLIFLSDFSDTFIFSNFLIAAEALMHSIVAKI